MTKLEQAARQALDALEKIHYHSNSFWNCLDEITALREALEAAPQQGPVTREKIREVFMANGFTVKEGQTDLKGYVYDAAYALLALAAPQPARQPLKDEEIIALGDERIPT